MRNPYVRTGLFICLIGTLVIIFGEIGARAMRLNPSSLITLDSCVGYKSIPSTQGFSAGPNGLTRITTNSAGFRDIEHAVEKPAGVYRVLFLGDSFTESLQVPIEDTFWRKIQALADARHIPMEVISMGVSSWSTGQEILAYECYGRKYHPDLVVLDFNGDDVLDNSFRQDPFTPEFNVHQNQLHLDESYKTNIAKRLEERNTLFPGALYFIKDHSMFFRYILFKIQNARAGEQLQTAANGRAPKMLEYSSDNSPLLETAWGLMGGLLERLAEDVHADNAQLMVVQFPTLVQFDTPEDMQSAAYDMQKPDKKLSSLATQLHIPLIDLYQSLSTGTSTTPAHFDNDPHLTAYGHTIAAQEIFDEILRVRK